MIRTGLNAKIMTIHWVVFLAGAFFGFIPGFRLLNTECRYLVFDDLWAKLRETEKSQQRRRKWWKLPLVWIDPVRGYVTANLLMQAFEASPESKAFGRLLPVLLGGSFLLISVFIQTCGRRDVRESISPAGFLAGVLVALLPPTISGAAIIIGVATAIVVRNYTAGYALAMITMAGIGYVFMGISVSLAIAVAAVGLPVLLNWLRGTHMVTPVRC